MASAWLVYPLLVIKIAVLFSPGSSGFVPEIHAPMDVHGHEAVLEVCLQFVQPLLGPWRVRVNARNDGEVKEGDNFLDVFDVCPRIEAHVHQVAVEMFSQSVRSRPYFCPMVSVSFS